MVTSSSCYIQVSTPASFTQEKPVEDLHLADEREKVLASQSLLIITDEHDW